MTYREALRQFKQIAIPDGIIKDKAAIRYAWSVYIDGLCKDGEITHKQYNTWNYPKEWD